MLQIGIIIPTLNAGSRFIRLLDSITKQQANITRKLIIDSGSSDNTVGIAKTYQYEVIPINQAKFNHGKTRQLGIDYLADIDIAVFLTQDVILYDENSIGKLIAAFKDLSIGAAYGRQLPHKGASLLAAQVRLFNYPPNSQYKSYADKTKLGIKTAFMSDSFAAYRITSLQAAGGFPHVIVNEDMYVAAKMLKQGDKIAYIAEACVYHSHDYTLRQEVQRYFDIGVFQQQEAWIRAEFGEAEGEGLRLVKEQLNYLVNNNHISSIPKAMLLNVAKLIGYRLGMHEKYLPRRLKKVLSGQSYFFK
ncbi:O antigen biosynthesis rhamnosyltransferase RfbN [uncultured Sporomusa sp.]|uniref:O antigen biosynthesis rhamnosyltransferase RfbN n=1 Tax=uncultured Sporomusa sp. TaxID=307249 RepID=A0A212M1S8_9FIRM|nr:glycosyltransferase [uncultured Sporomusa sp.]SCM83619.1 O antigen biosynthesis rhamnosyltransferase RfbN [uncultured Sporomusa sp.]